MSSSRPRTVIRGTLAVVVLALAPCSESAAITGQGIGARAGFMFEYDNPKLDEAYEHTNLEPKDLSMFGGHLTVLSISKVSAEVALEYASRDYRREIFGDAPGGVDATVVDVNFKVRDFAVYLTGRYKLIDGSFGIHLGGGVNFHRFTYGMDLSPILQWVNDDVQLPKGGWFSGFHALAGVSLGLPALPFRFFGEARIAKINVSGKAAQQATVLAGVTFGAF